MDLIYLQCDARYNKWLLEKIEGVTVIEYVIGKCKELKCSSIVAGIYKCADNEPLVEKLRLGGVDVIYSNKDVTEKFLNIVLKKDVEYCIRVCGDQLLLDTEETMRILNQIKTLNKDFYYEEINSCVIPDIVKVECLRKYEKKIRKKYYDRYFNILKNEEEVNRFSPKTLMLLYNFRANSNEGFRVCSNIIRNSLNIYDLSNKLANCMMNSQYLCKSGLLGSWIIPIEYSDFYYDEDKNINPWLEKNFIDFIKQRLSKEMSVFEWGTGNSTLFWSKYVKEVVSVEYDEKWYKKIRKLVPKNARVKYYELKYEGEYCRSILEEEQKFDIVFIDGRDRVNCAKNAVMRLKDDGIIIWDDIDRKQYQDGIDFLKKNGFKSIVMSGSIYGIAGIEGYTAIFYKQENIFGI